MRVGSIKITDSITGQAKVAAAGATGIREDNRDVLDNAR
jgi:hypothetical protein